MFFKQLAHGIAGYMSDKQKFELVVVLPVFRDWASFAQLLNALDAVRGDAAPATLVLAVNDSAQRDLDVGVLAGAAGKLNLQVLHLSRNLGHQRAIAVGLAWASENLSAQNFVVMDADGEDRAEDLHVLIDASSAHADGVIFAKRSRRSEALGFRISYIIYKMLFVLFTGENISFGNFCLIPGKRLADVVQISEIWNHLAAGILRARLPIDLVDTVRGPRLDGKSSMNLASLVAHGLSAISVFVDALAVRFALFVMGLLAIDAIAAGVVVGIRLFTDLAIPGWATTVMIGLLIMFLQLFVALLTLIIIVLSSRNRSSIIPAEDYKSFVHDLQRIKES